MVGPPVEEAASMGSLEETARLRVGLAAALAVFGVMSVPMLLGRLWTYGDLTHYYYPYRSFLALCISSGDNPAWYPNLFGGFFLYGEANGMAHPWVRFLYTALPLNLAL